MIVNGNSLLKAAPIVDMFRDKHKDANNVSYGLSEAGYDIRIKQTVHFKQGKVSIYTPEEHCPHFVPYFQKGNFVIASSIEKFNMPNDLVAVVHDKSTWARKGLSVFNTVIEPGWKGWLTLELVYHGHQELIIPAGSGIAQVLFSTITHPTSYDGKYNNQPNRPVEAR